MTRDSEGEPRLPDTPVGRQAAWFFNHSSSRGRDLTVEEVAAHMVFPPPWKPADSLERFQQADARPFEMSRLVSESPHALDVTVDYGDGKPFRASFAVEEDPPHRIRSIWWSRAVPDDVVLRHAGPADSAALNDLEVRAPMTLGPVTVTYDRGADFLGFTRLMEDNVCWVAERGGELLSLACGALHRVRIGGVEHSVMLLHHLRVPVEHRGGGFFSSLNVRVFGHFEGRMDAAYGYTAVDNAEGMRIGGPGEWSFGPFRAVLDCAALAGPPHGRVAKQEDAEVIVGIINRCHDAEEVFLPYTAESLAARLERAPDLYSWDNMLVGDGAVVGVWSAGLRVTMVDGRSRTESVRAVVLDHGFTAGAEAELERLVRAWCGRLVERGHTELILLTSEGTGLHHVVWRLAQRLDPFVLRMGVPEPEGTRERGIYVDAIYF